MSVTGPALVLLSEGEPSETVSVLSTVKAVLGPALGAVLLALSKAVPAGIVTLSVPSPVRLSSVIVRVAVPDPETDLLPAAAVPVAVTVTLSPASVTLSAPV